MFSRSRSLHPDGWTSVRGSPASALAPRRYRASLRSRGGAWVDLVWINTWVNETIKPLTDIEHWGVVDRWSYPDDGYGDCEDYVLVVAATR